MIQLKLHENPLTIDEMLEYYAQAEQTVRALNTRVVKPFEELAIAQNVKYEGQGVMVNIQQKTSLSKASVKSQVDGSVGELEMLVRMREQGRRIDGVRTIAGAPTLRLDLYTELLATYAPPPSAKTKPSVAVFGDVQTLAVNNRGNAALMAYQPTPVLLDDAGVAVYVAASEQIKLLNSHVINPAKKLLKQQGRKTEETTVDFFTFSECLVQIIGIPCFEPDYAGALKSLRAQNEPYVHIPEALDGAQTALTTMKNNFRQEVTTLYKPTDAVIIVP